MYEAAINNARSNVAVPSVRINGVRDDFSILALQLQTSC